MSIDTLDIFKSYLSGDVSIERKHPRTQRLLIEGEDFIADTYPDRRAENKIRQEEQLEFNFSKEAQKKVEEEEGDEYSNPAQLGQSVLEHNERLADKLQELGPEGERDRIELK